MNIEIVKGKTEVITRPKVILELSFEETQALREALAHIGGRIRTAWINSISIKLDELGFTWHQIMTRQVETSLYIDDIESIKSRAQELETRNIEEVNAK